MSTGRDLLTPLGAPPPTSGLLALHGNRLEWLADAVAEWLQRQPLAPLQREVLLVQSNGMAEWLKTALAERLGVCAAVQVQLPASFLWATSRQVLGPQAVPVASPLDETPLTWRLMALLPDLLRQPAPVYAPLASFLRDGGALRLLQLARRLADLFDQYQVYRADWLQAWAAGSDHLTDALGRPEPLPAGQAWQPALWRELLATLPPGAAQAARPQLQQRFVAALQVAAPGTLALPPRVVLFGTTHLSPPVLQALAALARHSQVLMALPNPCRWHWADAIAGREWLTAQRRRQPLRGGRDLAALPLQAMHLHAHPLLAAWGRQQRDFLRALDAFDDAEAARQRFGLARVDLFDGADGDDDPTALGAATQLQQLQAHIREGLPLAETPRTALAADDRSILFHVCHGAQREVEVLHDQLLHALAAPPPPGQAPLQPRDIVVMVPDIAAFAPAVEAVFGALPADDPRYIPYGITDLQERGRHPVLRALEWLLRLPQQRCTLAELHDLLDVPAVATRFGLAAEALPTLTRWMQQAGVRWGLDAAQRQALGLPADDDVHTLAWGLRRMLLGYAVGEAGQALDEPADDLAEPDAAARLCAVVPFDEVAGLDAACAGALADLLLALQRWARRAARPATPAQWAQHGRTLLGAFFRAADDSADARLLTQAAEALHDWATQCADAGLDTPLPLEVLREAWLPAVQWPGLHRRFRAGGVTFCTLMPLRAVPFEMVCLLGMNEADYPRRAPRSDFDLMGLPALARPGDRARRDDDRQLMLEALLSARRRLHLSWAGRSARDPAEQPPSVLVAQLRDHLAAVWGEAALRERTVHHPLQPFSRRNFDAAERWRVSHALEWRAVHVPPDMPGEQGGPVAAAVVLPVLRPAAPLSLEDLQQFLRHPERDHCRRQLLLALDELPPPLPQYEDFALDGLAHWQQAQALLQALQRGGPQADADAVLRRTLDRAQRSGALPAGAPGRALRQALHATLATQWAAWCALQAGAVPEPVPLPVRAMLPGAWPGSGASVVPGDDPGIMLSDQITGLSRTGTPGLLAWHALTPGRVRHKDRSLRPHMVLGAWVRQLAAAAAGQPVQAVLVAADGVLMLATPQADAAGQALHRLLALWRQNQDRPMPLPWRSAVLQAREAGEDRIAAAYDGDVQRPGERRDPVLARFWPDSAALRADTAFDALVGGVVQPLLAHLDVAARFDAWPQGVTPGVPAAAEDA